MNICLFHYYDESTGPYRNLSDLEPAEAERVMDEIRRFKKGFAAKRSADYMTVRRSLEARARELFIRKGGKPVRLHPHYMTLGECPWLLDWFEKGRCISIPIGEFDAASVSFTYGDLFPTMRYGDGKKYRGQVYTLPEILEVIREYGYPQEWNAAGDKGPERYVEAQIWDDAPLLRRIRNPASPG